LAEAGLEPPADYPGKAKLSTESDAKSDALSGDADIKQILAVWSLLPQQQRAEVLNLVDTSFNAR
jgi:hypothetical protein